MKCYKDVAKMRVWSYTIFVVDCGILGVFEFELNDEVSNEFCWEY